MTTDVVCMNESLDLRECEKLLLERGISGAPVVDDNGRLRGVLSKTDIVNHDFTSGEAEGGGEQPLTLEGAPGIRVFEYGAPKASDLMTPVPCTADVDATVGELAALMVKHKLHRVVICHKRKIVGIVSSLDVMRVVATKPLLAVQHRVRVPTSSERNKVSPEGQPSAEGVRRGHRAGASGTRQRA